MKTHMTLKGKTFLATLIIGLSAMAQPFPAHLATSLLADAGGPYAAEQYQSIKFADVDGDGYPDVCFLDAMGIKCAIYSSSTATFLSPTLWTTAFTLTSASDQSHWGTIQYADMNGDGKADLCGRQSYGMACYFSNGTQFLDTSTFANGFNDSMGFGSPSQWSTIRLIDVDGDGLKDVCGRFSGGIGCQRLLKGTTSFIFDSWSFWTTKFGDADGWNNDPSFWSTIQFADLNGDHRPDVCGRNISGIVCSLNNGSTFEPTRQWTSQFSDASGWRAPEYYSTIRFADINGDGKADVCGRGSAGVYCGISVNSFGSMVFSGADVLVASDFSDASGWNHPEHYQDIWLVDVDGDNKADICGRGSSGIFCATSTSSPSSAAAQFSAGRLWINNFGNNFGWNLSPSYWATVQPLRTIYPTPRGTSFCGRGHDGIFCSTYH